VDHFFVAGGATGGGFEVLDAAPLSDHRPVRVAVRTSTAQ
jgi:endonuclease/exonuclease/phosphatase family metal-dependent hydrolase